MPSHKAIREREVHPLDEVGVLSAVAAPRAVGSVVLAAHRRMEAPHTPELGRHLLASPKRQRENPPDRPGQAPERIFAVARPIVHAGHRPGVERLQQQRPDTGNEGRDAGVYRPRRAVLGEETAVFASLEAQYPWRRTVRVARKRQEKTRTKT